MLSSTSKRSASELSLSDEGEIVSDTDDHDQGYIIPRYHRKKLTKKPKMSPSKNNTNSYSGVVQSKSKEKLPSTWGKIKATSSFRGAVSDVFLHNLDMSVTVEDVKDYFKGENVSIRKVEKLSHQEAARSSFKLSPVTQEDYDKILSGQVLPEGVGVRKFIPPRRNTTGISLQNNGQSSMSGKSSAVARFENAMMQIDNLSQDTQVSSKSS